MKPIRYDFPHRLRTPGSALREVRKLQHSHGTAVRRGDVQTAHYLGQRIARAQEAAKRFRDLDLTAL